MASENLAVWTKRRDDTLEGQLSLSNLTMVNSRGKQPMTMTADCRRLSRDDNDDCLPASAFDRRNAGFLGVTRAIVEKHLANGEFNLHMLARDLINCASDALIRDRRPGRAAQRLPDLKMAIVEIACAVGFSGPKYFRRVFRETFGMLPSANARQFDSACSGPTMNQLRMH